MDATRNRQSTRVITSYVNPPIPDRAWDWSAHFEGREEWLTGRGGTEQAAISNLYEQASEKDALGVILLTYPSAYIYRSQIISNMWSVWTGGDLVRSLGVDGEVWTGMLSASEVSEEHAVELAIAKMKREGLLREVRHGW